jgi:hypothetical protein
MSDIWREAEDYAAYQGEGVQDDPPEPVTCDRCRAKTSSLETVRSGHDPTDYDEEQWCERCVERLEHGDDFSYSPDCP